MTQPSPLATDLILHRLVKDAHGPARVELRSTPLPGSEAALRLVERIGQHYADRPGKGYGKFEEDEEQFPVAHLLRSHVVERSLDFVSLSQRMMEVLRMRASEESLAEGGYVLFARVRNDASDWLFVAVISEASGSSVSQGLEVIDSAHLDIGNLRVAGRVDLTAWQQGAERYVSFLKGRGDVAQYFKLFLGCNDLVLALKETRKLVETLNHFADVEKLEAPVRDQLMERAHVYLDELGEASEPVDLDQIAAQVWPQEPQRLATALHDQEAELAGGFVPDRRAIKSLVRFKAKATHWKLEFDRGSLRNGAVVYDRAADTLVLSNIPDSLKRLLLDE